MELIPIIIFIVFFIVYLLCTLLWEFLFLLSSLAFALISAGFAIIFIVVAIIVFFKERKNVRLIASSLISSLLFIVLMLCIVYGKMTPLNNYNYVYFEARKMHGSIKSIKCFKDDEVEASCKIVLNDKYKIPFTGYIARDQIFNFREYYDDYCYNYAVYFIEEYNKLNNTDIKLEYENRKIIYKIKNYNSKKELDEIKSFYNFVNKKLNKPNNFMIHVYDENNNNISTIYNLDKNKY